jgi:hypothetical protein
MATWFKFGSNDKIVNLTENSRVLYEIAQAERVGVPVVSFELDRRVHGSAAYESGTDWLFDAAHPLDSRTATLFDAVVAAAPTALLLPTVYPYFDAHGDGSCVDPSTPCEKTLLLDVQNASNSKRGFANSPSPSWVGNVSAQLRELMCYLDSRYPGRLMGVQLNGMETGEWFQEGMGGHSDPSFYADYSQASIDEFCAGRPQPCHVPTPAERAAAAVGNTLASPAAAAFNLFLATRTARALAAFARVAKAASAGHAFVGYYFGYVYALAGRRGAGSGHLALRTLLDEPAVDAVLAPYRRSMLDQTRARRSPSEHASLREQCTQRAARFPGTRSTPAT